MNDDLYVQPCPVCGKQPRIKRDFNYKAAGDGTWCIIQCKPLFRRPHLVIEGGKVSWDLAVKDTVDRWNKVVSKDYKNKYAVKHLAAHSMFNVDENAEKSHPLPFDTTGLTYDYWG